jgi:hypothetical protein
MKPLIRLLTKGSSRRSGILLAWLLSASLAGAQVTVVNMIPNALSGETGQDSEPNLAVNPANPLQIAGSAFTVNPSGVTSAPIFVSTDGGNTWVLNNIVPSGNGATGDITLRFGGTSNNLYAGILLGGSGLHLNILRTANFSGSTAMTVLVDRLGSGVDQPYVQAATAMGGSGVGQDRVYVGDNDFNGSGGKTATIDRSLSAAAPSPAPAGFSNFVIEPRATNGQDLPPIRPAIHPDGTVYAIYYGWRAGGLTDVVVVRDDNWGSGASPFTALTDPNDGLAGQRVVTGLTVPFENFSHTNFGQERLVASSLSIAVDPRNSSNLYVAWADRPSGTGGYNLHVRSSNDRGVTWSTADLLTITNAINPALAINSRGTVGFLYQQNTGSGAAQRWETHLQRSPNGTTWTDLTLANVPANAPAFTFLPYLGDYDHLMAVGKDFCGIFSANNTPDMSNFPNGVTFQRNIDTGTTQLRNVSNTSNVPVSIDPFFFRATELAPASDFYVRDWTDNATSGDNGLEPSTHPVFYETSDVWNRRGTLTGEPFANDQPANEDAGNGVGNIGDNWAFARIRRNALPTSGAETVTAHFLVSQFGTGSNFQDASTTDPGMPGGPDPTVPFNATDLGPIITPAYQWHLPAISSTHLCLAVEISTPNDPFIPPSLVGSAPGWSTGTDWSVLADNNKAQRNMGLSTTPARGIGGTISYYAIIHNAALERRKMVLRSDALPAVARRLEGAQIEVIGGRAQAFKSGAKIILDNMQPGENRWVGLTFKAPAGKEGEILAVNFSQLMGETPVNGFTIAAGLASFGRAIHDTLELHRSVFTRCAEGFQVEGVKGEVDVAQELRKREGVDEQEYLKFIRSHLPIVERAVAKLIDSQRLGDPFGVKTALKNLATLVQSGSAESTAVAHMTLLNKLDAFLTMVQLSKGDVADILQNVRWQKELYTKVPRLKELGVSAELLKQSEEFIVGYEGRKLRADSYPKFISSLMKSFRETAQKLENAQFTLKTELTAMEQSMDSPAGLQKAHRSFLLKLQSLAK